MELGDIPLWPVDTSLYGFAREVVHSLGQISLPFSSGIDPSTAVNNLNLDPAFSLVKQKKRNLGPKKDKIIQKEACPKDFYPLPHVDQLVNSTSSHELLSLMDASQGYHQIMLNPDDQKFISQSTKRSLPFFEALRKTKNFVWDEECQQAFQDPKIYFVRLPPLTKPTLGEPLYLYLAVGKTETSERMIKWAIKFSEYDISYQRKFTIKAKVLAEFVNEATLMEEDERNWLLHADGSSTLAGSGPRVVLINQEGANWIMLYVST
ncbi:UNVERIFIED_CONTAM: hypothetical protein Scaly_1919700 [Sesamum calycinum]|uniref:Reverse transcriptase/retrotransposon-derived protein RNase H-like domain-containing protein n=1 Tax=Sesamum calycinum TaxID=2727403 RepID=A0AAW2NGH9_9LAMI